MAIEPKNVRVLSNTDVLTADGSRMADAVGSQQTLGHATGRLLDQSWTRDFRVVLLKPPK